MRRTILAGVVVSGMFGAQGVLLYSLFFEAPYLSYPDLPLEVMGKPGPEGFPIIHPGEVVPIFVNRCNSSGHSHTYTIARSLENLDSLQTIVLPESLVPIKRGCSGSPSLANRVPRELFAGIPFPPGRYRIVGLSSVQGTFKTFLVPWSSSEFHVAP